MHEAFPIFGGVIAGLFSGLLPRRAGLLTATALGSVIAVAATLVSGEYRLSLYFILTDAALAIMPALCASMALATVRQRRSNMLLAGSGYRGFWKTRRVEAGGFRSKPATFEQRHER